MRSIPFPGILLLAAMLAACGQDAPTAVVDERPAQFSRSSAQCQNIGGTVEAHFLTPAEQAALPAYAADADISGTLFDAEGTAIGEAYAWILALKPAGNGALRIEMQHRYVIGGSQFDTRDRGELSPIDPPLYHFNNRLEVSGGTGVFADAGGSIRAHGTVVIGGGIELRYHGRLCV